jgi:hypothetical protein
MSQIARDLEMKRDDDQERPEHARRADEDVSFISSDAARCVRTGVKGRREKPFGLESEIEEIHACA